MYPSDEARSYAEKYSQRSSARRLVPASYRGSSGRRIQQDVDKLSRTSKGLQGMGNAAAEYLLPAISNRSFSKQSYGVAGSQGSAPYAQHSSLNKSGRGSSARIGQRKPSQTPRGSGSQGFQKSYQLTEHVAEYQAKQIMAMSQSGSNRYKDGASLSHRSRAAADRSDLQMDSIPAINDENGDIFNNLTAEDVGLGKAYQTQPVNSSMGATNRENGNIQFHPPPEEAGKARAKGAAGMAADLPSRHNSSGLSLSRDRKKQQPKVNAWEQFEVNQFKVRNQEPSQIISKLKVLTASDIPFQGELPPDDDMDSTDPLDSFMYAFVKIVNEKAINWTTEVRRGIHLATHTRTDFCEKMLTFICHHQKLEQAFRDCVDFFMESLTNLVRLEDENKRMNAEIESLLNLKEDSIVVKFKLEQRLKEYLHNSEKIQKREHQANAKITYLQKLLSDKNAECESLQYRLQHFQEVGGVEMSAPASTRQGTGGGAVPNPAEDEKMRASKAAGMDSKPSQPQTPGLNEAAVLRDLQLQNQRLEEEVEGLREALTKQDHSNHFRKIQGLFNKIQIENKNLRIYNQKCESKLESRQTLINHLEDKLSSEIGNYKEKIVALEAEIKVLTCKNRQNEEKTQQQLQAQKRKLLADFKLEHDEKIKNLEAEVVDNEKQKSDLRKRLERILREHDELSNEFRRFRAEKEIQEAERNQLYEALEKKIVHYQYVDHDKINYLNKQIDEQENKCEVLEKENAILLLRQKYLKQHTEMLHKYKLFLESTLIRGKGEIWENLKIIEKKILEDNNNENFLISIRKCFEYANQVAGMGSNVLDNIQQILAFLKIEKLHSLLSDAQEIEALEQNVQQTIEKSRENQSAQSIVGKISPTKKQETPGQTQGVDKDYIQRLLSQIGAAGSDTSPPLNMSKASGGGAASAQQSALGQPAQKRDNASLEKNEAFYIRSNPIELACACLKMHVESLIHFKAYQSAQELPGDLQQLLYHCSMLTNPDIENEIVYKFFAEVQEATLKLQLRENVTPGMGQMTPSLQNIAMARADGTHASSLQGAMAAQQNQPLSQTSSSKQQRQQSQRTQEAFSQPQQLLLATSPSDPAALQQHPQTHLSSGVAHSSEEKAGAGGGMSRADEPSTPGGGTSMTKSGDLPLQSQEELVAKLADQEQLYYLMEKQRLEIETHINKLDHIKLKSRDMQLNLAGKIVVLEEQIERMNAEKDEQIKQLELAHAEELQRAMQGVEQREAQLVQLCDEYREEVRDLQWKLETQWRPAEESKTIYKMEQGTRGNLYKLMKDYYEAKFKESQDLLQNYQASINEFVYLREDLRGSFTLAFDCAKLPSGILDMINESLLRYYLSKTFLIDKSKFRFLRSEELIETMQKQQQKLKAQDGKSKPQSILKLIIEVVAHDSVKISQLFKDVKAQIKDGTSLLYDFMPLYFGMNLGSSGFSTHHNLGEFALLSKTGQTIDGVEYIVSVLRHKQNPLIFKVIAFNLERREEYMMELNESDVYELVEGDYQILRNVEPDELIQKITTNLNLIERDKIKVLSCDQKIFFNEIWAERMESAKNYYEHKRSPMEAQWQADRSPLELTQKVLLTQSPITHTAARTSQLSRLEPRLFEHAKDFVQKFTDSKESQTDFPIADLYEGYENVFRGVQKVGEVTHMRLFIKQSMKTSTLIFEIDDLTSLKKLKFSLYTKDSDDHYVIHTECMKITDGHHVLISIEYIQKEGLMIRMFDLLDCKAVTFSLLRKYNGQYARLPDESQLDLLLRHDFRNFLYELQLHVNKQANENIIRNYQYLFRQEVDPAKKSARTLERENEYKKQVESKKRDVLVSKISASKSLPRRKRAQHAQRLLSFSSRAFYKDKWSRRLDGLDQAEQRPESPTSLSSNQIEAQSNQMDWRDSPGEKGILLYRNVFHVRWVSNGSEPEPRQSVITLYLKDQLVQMEVLLYQDPAKMSIGSEINAITLFGEDPLGMPFKDRVNILNTMMEKFFITSIDSVYHMKVESEQMPIQQFLAELEESKKVKGRGEGKAAQGIDSMFHQVQDMPNKKGSKDEDQLYYQRIADIDGVMHDVEIQFRKKQKGKTERTGKHAAKKSSFGKSGVEKTQADIEQYLDDFCIWDSIYFEVTDPRNEKITALYDKKKIAYMLAKDEFLDWRATLSSYNPLLLDYIQKSIHLDKDKEELTLHNRVNIEQKIFEKYRKVIGGRYHQRKDLDLSEDEKAIVNKLMICNLEVEFSEFLYDIKIYELQRVTDKDVISYQIEIFMLHEPEVAYLYNYPMNSASQIQDPHTLVIEEFNLIDNGLKKSLEIEKKNRATQKKGQTGVQNRRYSSALEHHSTSAAGGRGQDQTTKAEMEQARLLQKSIDRKQDIQRQLFRKYIDNRVILLVQEYRFPRKLDFILVEPCSQLAWRHQIEPRLITTGLGSMHLVDQATLESFLSVMIDEVQAHEPASAKVFEYESAAEEKQSLPFERVKSHRLQPEGTMQTKAIVHNFEWMQNDDSVLIKDQVILEDDFKLSITKLNDTISVVIEKMIVGGPALAEVHEVTMGQVQGEREPNQVVLRFRPLEGNTVIARVIRVRGLSYSMLFVRVIGPHTFIKIVELQVSSIVTVFKLHFQHDEKMGHVLNNQGDESERSEQERLRLSQLSDKQIFTSRDTQRSILDAIRRFYGSQFIDQGMRVYEKQKELIDRERNEEYEEPTVFERMDDEYPSIHATRTATRQFLDMAGRTIVLHRKAYFDDQLEKLILMQIRLRLDGEEYLQFKLKQEPHAFLIVLLEPDSTHEVEFITPLQQCLTQEELFFDEQRLRDVSTLRRLAKRVLEERVQINRIEAEDGLAGTAHYAEDNIVEELNQDLQAFEEEEARYEGNRPNILKNYRLDINFDPGQRMGADAQGSGRVGDMSLDDRYRQLATSPPNFADTTPAFFDDAGVVVGDSVVGSGHAGSAEHQMYLMQQRADLDEAFQPASGGPGGQSSYHQRGPVGSAGNYGNNQSTILEEAASNEEDGDQAAME